MKKRYSLPNFKIEFNGARYDAKVRGDDEKGAGGLWDLSGAFADGICEQLDGDVYFNDDLEGAYMIIQEAAYNLIKYTLLPTVEKQINKQSEM
jgi:hypothetical protein